MSQISPPMRIVLIGAVVFLAAWVAFLRPGGDAGTTTPAATAPAATPAATATAESAAGKAVQNARKAADAASAASAASAKASDAAGSETTEETAAAGSSTAAASKADAAKATSAKEGIQASKVGLPVNVAKALAADKVLVLYLWDPKAGDDRIVRSELRHVDRHKGKVAVAVANVRKVARYAPIARGVDVQQSPAIVVVDRHQRGTLLQGYADAGTIDQFVSDALRAKA
jgi:hypothetical protein